MTQEPKQFNPMPPVMWWFFGTVTLYFFIVLQYAGFDQAIWWLGFLLGFIILAFLSLKIQDSFEHTTGFYDIFDTITKLSWIFAAFIYAFGALVTGVFIFSPIVTLISPFIYALGWIVLIVGVIWLYSRYIKERGLNNIASHDIESQRKFENYLQENEPSRFDRYISIKQKYQLQIITGNLNPTWQDIAQEAGVSISEIFKVR